MPATARTEQRTPRPAGQGARGPGGQGAWLGSFGPSRSGYCFTMPKVDPETNEPMSDAPTQDSDDVRGGKRREEMPSDINPTGSGGPLQKGHTTSEPKDTSPGSTDAGSAD